MKIEALTTNGELEDAFFFSDKMGFSGSLYCFPELSPLNLLAVELGVKPDSYFGCVAANLYGAYNNKKPLVVSRDKSLIKPAFLRVLDALKAGGYVEYKRGFKGVFRGFRSRYWASDRLAQLFKLIKQNRLKDYTPPVIQMSAKVDGLKVKIPAVNKPAEVVQREAEIKAFNSLLNAHTFRLQETPFLPSLSAVYCNGDYQQGGRLYSVGRRCTVSYQGFSGDERLQITIDGEVCTELDYKCLHPHLLYAQAGIQLIGDAYAFASAAERPLAKLLLLVAFNAEDDRAVCKAFQKRVVNLYKKRRQGTLNAKDEASLHAYLKVRRGRSAYRLAEALLKQAREYHSSIASSFGSGIGTSLQNIDAHIMQLVINQCVTAGIPVLPVHDSVVCRVRDAEYVQGVMFQAFKTVTGFICPIENKKQETIFNPLRKAG